MHPHPTTFTEAQRQRFWSHVDQSDPAGCWPWKASTRTDLYGQITVAGVTWATHRLAYTLAYGSIPAEMWVLHHCDNRRCCRPDHLFLGTPADNSADMVRKGRYRGVVPPPRQGMAHHMAKLSDEEVYAIRIRADGGETVRSIARAYGMTNQMIYLIARRRKWTHLPERPPAAVADGVRDGLFRRPRARLEVIVALNDPDTDVPACFGCLCALRPLPRGIPALFAAEHDAGSVSFWRICGPCAAGIGPSMWTAWRELCAMRGQQEP